MSVHAHLYEWRPTGCVVRVPEGGFHGHRLVRISPISAFPDRDRPIRAHRRRSVRIAKHRTERGDRPRSGLSDHQWLVYHDRNENGLLDAGEPLLGGVPMELRNSGGAVVGTDTTDAVGYYEFSSDSTANPPEEIVSYETAVPEQLTDWVATGSLPQFDPALGILTRVEVTGSAEITSQIKAESQDSDPQLITAIVSGEIGLALSSSYQLASTPNVDAGTFSAAPYDGTPDFGGPSGHDFGTHSATDSSTLIIADAGTAFFVGTGSVPFSASALATSRTTGGGNVLNEIATTASAAVAITYHYQPHVCLNQGNYTIIEAAQPLGYGDHLETRGNSAPIPNTIGTDEISVTLTNTDLINNNFGEIKGSLSGFVYVDFSDDGIFDANEPPIANVTVTLTGTDAHGNAVSRTMLTAPDGSYLFAELCTGTYVIVETQPPQWLDGKDTIGSQGGSVEDDRLFEIDLEPAEHGIQNNFGELPPPTPSPTPTPTPTPPGTVLSETPTPTPTPTGSPAPTEPPGTGTPPPSATEGTATAPTGTSRDPQEPSPTADKTSVAGTPQPPDAGGGLAFGSASVNIVLGAVVLASAGSGLAVMILGRRRDEDIVGG